MLTVILKMSFNKKMINKTNFSTNPDASFVMDKVAATVAKKLKKTSDFNSMGYVITIADNVINVRGLNKIMLGEVVYIAYSYVVDLGKRITVMMKKVIKGMTIGALIFLAYNPLAYCDSLGPLSAKEPPIPFKWFLVLLLLLLLLTKKCPNTIRKFFYRILKIFYHFKNKSMEWYLTVLLSIVITSLLLTSVGSFLFVYGSVLVEFITNLFSTVPEAHQPVVNPKGTVPIKETPMGGSKGGFNFGKWLRDYVHHAVYDRPISDLNHKTMLQTPRDSGNWLRDFVRHGLYDHPTPEQQQVLKNFEALKAQLHSYKPWSSNDLPHGITEDMYRRWLLDVKLQADGAVVVPLDETLRVKYNTLVNLVDNKLANGAYPPGTDRQMYEWIDLVKKLRPERYFSTVAWEKNHTDEAEALNHSCKSLREELEKQLIIVFEEESEH
jgi:hypothetical protein